MSLCVSFHTYNRVLLESILDLVVSPLEIQEPCVWEVFIKVFCGLLKCVFLEVYSPIITVAEVGDFPGHKPISFCYIGAQKLVLEPNLVKKNLQALLEAKV